MLETRSWKFLFLASLTEIVAGFQQFDFLEITRKAVISHV